MGIQRFFEYHRVFEYIVLIRMDIFGSADWRCKTGYCILICKSVFVEIANLNLVMIRGVSRYPTDKSGPTNANRETT